MSSGLVVGRLLHEREVVECLHDLLGVGVVLAALADPDPAGALELGLGPGVAVTAEHVFGEVGQPTPADDRRRAAEASVDDVRAEPDDLEELRAAVGVDRGDAHLRQDLEHAGLDGGLEAGLRLGADEVLVVGLVGAVAPRSRARGGGRWRRRRSRAGRRPRARRGRRR